MSRSLVGDAFAHLFPPQASFWFADRPHRHASPRGCRDPCPGARCGTSRRNGSPPPGTRRPRAGRRRVLHHLTTEPLRECLGETIVPSEEFSPAAVAQLLRTFGRADDVGEHHRSDRPAEPPAHWPGRLDLDDRLVGRPQPVRRAVHYRHPLTGGRSFWLGVHVRKRAGRRGRLGARGGG
jgi:hypothetical protein